MIQSHTCVTFKQPSTPASSITTTMYKNIQYSACSLTWCIPHNRLQEQNTMIKSKYRSECKVQTQMNCNQNYPHKPQLFNTFLILFLKMIIIQTLVTNINNNLKCREQAAISYTSMFYKSDNDVYLCLYTFFSLGLIIPEDSLIKP